MADVLLEALLAYPYLIPLYLVGLWYIVVKPLTRLFDTEAAQKESKLRDEYEAGREAICSEDSGIRQLLARTYEARLAGRTAKFNPHNQRFAESHGSVEKFINDQGQVEIARKLGKIYELTNKPFDSSEILVETGIDWALTNKTLYVLDGDEESSAACVIPLDTLRSYQHVSRDGKSVFEIAREGEETLVIAKQLPMPRDLEKAKSIR